MRGKIRKKVTLLGDISVQGKKKSRNYDLLREFASTALFAGFAVMIALYINPNGRLSDIKGFYSIRFDDLNNSYPYAYGVDLITGTATTPVEYPVLTGIFMWLISYLVPDKPNWAVELIVYGQPLLDGGWVYIFYYRLSAIILGIFFIITSFYIRRLTGRIGFFFFITSPGILGSLFLNWDIVAVLFMVTAIYAFKENRLFVSSVLLSLGVSAKFFPIVLIVPITIILFRSRRYIELVRYVLGFFVGWLLVNFPVYLKDGDGWLYFYRFSATRPVVGDGTIYQAINYLGLNWETSTTVYVALNVLGLVSLIFFLFSGKLSTNLVGMALFPLVVFVTFGKVVSVQFVLWLTPLVLFSIYSLPKKHRGRLTKYFFLWQAIEVLYHIGFYQQLIWRMSKSLVGIDPFTFGIISASRHVFLIYIAILIAQVTTRASNEGIGTKARRT